MKNKENQSQCGIYLRHGKRWVEVPEEVFRKYYAMVSNYRRKRQRHGCCVCPKCKRLLCDTDCAVCEFSRAGSVVSLNMENEIDGHVMALSDIIADETVNIEKMVMEKDILETLQRILKELSPEEYEMCRLWMEGKSGRELARIMGISPATCNRRWKRLLVEMREKLKEYI